MCVGRFVLGTKQCFSVSKALLLFPKGIGSLKMCNYSAIGHGGVRVCQNTQYKNIKLVVCPFMDAQRVFHFSVNLTFKSLVGNKYCVYRHK